MKLKLFNFETTLDLGNNKINVIDITDIRLFRKIVETVKLQITNEEVEEKIYAEFYNEPSHCVNTKNAM